MSIRTERLGSVIQKDLGKILQEKFQPPGTFVTVTRVQMTEDLTIAKVYLSVYAPGREEKPIYKLIDDSQDEIRYLLAQKIKNQVRRIPELLFFEDDTAEYINKLEKIFEKTRRNDPEKS